MSKEILALNWVNLIFTFWPIRKKNSGNFLLFSKFGKIFDIESIAKITSRKICSVGWFAQIGWFFHAKISPYKVDASFFSLTWSLTGKQETLREKVSKYRVFSGPYFPVFGPEKTPYLDTFAQWRRRKDIHAEGCKGKNNWNSAKIRKSSSFCP